MGQLRRVARALTGAADRLRRAAGRSDVQEALWYDLRADRLRAAADTPALARSPLAALPAGPPTGGALRARGRVPARLVGGDPHGGGGGSAGVRGFAGLATLAGS